MLGGVCFIPVRKVLGSPQAWLQFLDEHKSVTEAAGLCGEAGCHLLRRGHVGGAGLILRVLWSC